MLDGLVMSLTHVPGKRSSGSMFERHSIGSICKTDTPMFGSPFCHVGAVHCARHDVIRTVTTQPRVLMLLGRVLGPRHPRSSVVHAQRAGRGPVLQKCLAGGHGWEQNRVFSG